MFIEMLAQVEAMQPTSLSNWDVIKIATPVVATLSGAVAALWKIINKSMTKAEIREEKLAAELTECNNLHRERDILQVEMASKIGKLEGLMIGHEQAREDLRSLSEVVINLIHDQGKEIM